ncbi:MULTISPECIES: hypothetical protein [Bradyrhizobium]|uniref:hypothetical protein n=1 Tax=Bradyrhizobium elkanii TaxID=29448 RepID=UPI0004263110|nr:hypothetical protein [Bradyrhizobium elkanii]
MNDKIDQFCDKLRLQLTRIDDALSSISARMQAEVTATEAEIRAHLAELELHIDARRSSIENAARRIDAWEKAKLDCLEERAAEWKQRRDVTRLQRQATESEDLAAQAFEVALFAIERAEHVAIEARLARTAAEEAAVQAPA